MSAQKPDRADLAEADTLWLNGGDVEIDGDEFVDALQAVERLVATVDEIRDELEDLNTGLEREDAIRLIYAKNHNLTLDDVRLTFEAIDELADSNPTDAGARLLALNTDLGITDAGEVLDEMGELADKYADPSDEQ